MAFYLILDVFREGPQAASSRPWPIGRQTGVCTMRNPLGAAQTSEYSLVCGTEWIVAAADSTPGHGRGGAVGERPSQVGLSDTIRGTRRIRGNGYWCRKHLRSLCSGSIKLAEQRMRRNGIAVVWN